MRLLFRLFLPLAGLLATPSPALAADPPPETLPARPRPRAFAVVVGSNEGGAGQGRLRFAEDDAARFAQTIRDVGRYDAPDVRVLRRPSVARLLATLDEVGASARAARARGDEVLIFFYYSGHARASALNVGREELGLGELRDRLRALPSTMTLVVLDACQSGAFARTKGAEPAADFSYNSVARLGTQGIAVMASSSAQELSQESDELRSSYFTHHLVVALRGAGDGDGDGRVSLDEAYRYAYRRTLASTTRTQVGGQHVTLETDLAGQGDVPLTFPATARSQLELPAALDGRVLVQHRASGSVVAEVHKAAGRPLRLALPEGAYEAIVRQRSGVMQCKLTLASDRVTVLDVARCEAVREVAVAKGGGFVAPPIHRWVVELGAGVILRTEDEWTARLNEFGYAYEEGWFELWKAPRWKMSAAGLYRLSDYIAVGIDATTLTGDHYTRDISSLPADEIRFATYAAHALLRGSTGPLGGPSRSGAFAEAYGQLGVGPSMGTLDIRTSGPGPNERSRVDDTQWGYALSGAVGLGAEASRFFGAAVQLGYDYAPAHKNLVGDRHNGGGPSMQILGRLHFE